MTISQEQTSHFVREMTQQERRFLRPANSHISIVARLLGDIQEKALRQAVDKMLITYPLFGVRVEWSEESFIGTTEGASEVPVTVYSRESDDTWLEALNKEHAIPVRPSKGPLTRFILVKGAEVSDLIVFCHHLICDGRSLELALHEVLLHLGDPKREPPIMFPAPPQTPEIFPEDVSASRFRSWFIHRLNKKWEKEKVIFDEEDMENLWVAFWKNSRYCVETVLFDEDETHRLIEACRDNGVTINSLLNAAVVRARIETIGPYSGKITATTAVDTRDRLRVEVGHSVGLYAGGIRFKYDYKEDKPFWDNVKEYHKVVHKELKDNNVFGPIFDQFIFDPTFIDGMLFATLGDLIEPHQSRYEKISQFAQRTEGLLAKYFDKMDSSIPDIMMTNLGRLGIPDRVQDISVERVLFTPSSGLKMELVLAAATAGGKLSLTLNYYQGYIDGDNIKRVREKTEEILRELIAP